MEKLEKSILESNKHIAEFMRWEKSDSVYRTVEFYNNEKVVGNFTHPLHMKFNKSWDWLMPVIEKINLMDDCRFTVYIASMDTEIKDNMSGKVVVEVTLKYSVDELIKSAYEAVVEFIKWYNDNK